MPILEYRCQGCRAEFDWLSGVVDDGAEAVCPRCAGRDLKRKLSVFATASSDGPAAGGGCDDGPCASDAGGSGPCGGGFCQN